MQGLVVPRNGVHTAAEGLDFFQLVPLRVVAVGAAAYVQALPVARQADFGFMAGAAPLRDELVAFAPLLCRGYRR